MYDCICPTCSGLKITAAEPLPPKYLTEIEKAINATLKQLYSDKTPDNKMFVASGKALSEQVRNSYGEIITDWTTPDVQMQVQLSRNVWQFAAAKNYQQLKDLSLALQDDNGKLREWDDFKDAADKIGVKYNEIWMRTEYDQCIAGAQNAARWVEFEQQADIMPNLQYQTIGDNNVRESHRILNGITRPMSDDFWNTHYPPNGWGCRCEAIQVPDGLAAVTPKENIPPSLVPQMFRTNLAKEGLIFPKGHPYYKGIPQSELRKAIAYLPPENTFESVVIGDWEIDINLLHGKGELEKNIENCYTLLHHDQNAKLKLLPVINENEIDIKDKFFPKEYIEKFGKKNADCLYNGRVVEFEEPSGEGWSIKNTIRDGKKQSDFVILRTNNNVDWNNVERQVFGQLNHYNGQNFELWIMNENELRKYKPKSK